MLTIDSVYDSVDEVWIVKAQAPKSLISSTQKHTDMILAIYESVSSLAEMLDNELAECQERKENV